MTICLGKNLTAIDRIFIVNRVIVDVGAMDAMAPTRLGKNLMESSNFFDLDQYICTQKYSGEILTIKLFILPYSTFWSHFIVYMK